jgi:beta-galactosidase/beta-glucuronidase
MPRRHLAQLGLTRDDDAPRAPPDQDYPRPQLRRPGWTRLDGEWDFALDANAAWSGPVDARFDRKILVPFAPETPRSGVGANGFFRAVWYRRRLPVGPLADDDRLVLHFGAVDYEATVWVNGALAARHEGGYTPFSVDLTTWAKGGHALEIVVRAEDDPADLAKPRGKQDWQLEPHSIWYPRTTGIWQSVWIETLARAHVASLRWTPNLTQWALGFDARIEAPPGERFWLGLRLASKGVLLAEDQYAVVAGEVHRTIALSDPGIDDFRSELLWSPSAPTLIDAEITLVDATGRAVDRVGSYTALRSFQIEGDRFVLNGRPFVLRMVLDQGYWPETGLTAPDGDALRRDVLLAKRMGFDGARKHQKIEDPRWLYWADRLGLLVWAEMPRA